MKRISASVILLLIIFLATFTRLYKLGSNPSSPYWEEVALGYDAFSISQTGKDFHGNPYPILAFTSYGDFKPSGYFYALAPFVKLLGLNSFVVRLPSALAGIISVGLLYLIGKKLFDQKIGLIASALFAISPWAIQFSRGGWEVNLAMMLTMAGAYCLILSRKKYWALPIAVILFGLSMYTYHAARLFAPIVGGLGGIGLLWLWWRETAVKVRAKLAWPLFVSVVVGLVFVLPFVVNIGNQVVSSRFSQTTVLSDLEPVLKSNAQISSHGSTFVARLVYHRYWYYAQTLIQGWLKHFSPEFLFVRGDGNLRHWNGRYGMLYPMDLIFVVIALFSLVMAHRQRSLRGTRVPLLLIVGWIMLAAVPPSLVKPTPHALRFLFAAPAFALLSAVGISLLMQGISKRVTKIFIIVLVFAYAYLFGSYFFWYMNIYPSRAANDWQYGYEQVFDAVKREKKVGEKVYMTRDQGRPSMFYLYFNSYDPAKIQTAGVSLPKDQQELLQVDDYYFVDALPSIPAIYATPLNGVDPQAKVLDTIRRPDGSVVWVVWRKE